MGRPSPSWALAACAIGAPLCCQLLPYELPLLVLVLPYLGELLASENPRDRLAALVIAAFGTFAFLPGGERSMAEDFASLFGFARGIEEVLLSHRSVGVACLAGTILLRGPLRPSASAAGHPIPHPSDPASAGHPPESPARPVLGCRSAA